MEPADRTGQLSSMLQIECSPGNTFRSGPTQRSGIRREAHIRPMTSCSGMQLTKLVCPGATPAGQSLRHAARLQTVGEAARPRASQLLTELFDGQASPGDQAAERTACNLFMVRD